MRAGDRKAPWRATFRLLAGAAVRLSGLPRRSTTRPGRRGIDTLLTVESSASRGRAPAKLPPPGVSAVTVDICEGIRGARYVSIRHAERLAEAGIALSTSSSPLIRIR